MVSLSLLINLRKMRKSQQLFVHYREHSQGLPMTKQRLSHWLCDAITQAYVSAGAELEVQFT